MQAKCAILSAVVQDVAHGFLLEVPRLRSYDQCNSTGPFRFHSASVPMHAGIVQMATALFWIAGGLVVCFAAGMVGFLIARAGRVDPARRALLQQEVIWTLTSALLVVGLAVASDLMPHRSHPLPAARAR